MLKCAQECSKNPSSKHLTFGEFYKFANDLIRTDCRITSTSPSTRVLEKNVEKRRGKFSRGMSRYEVFLGGSCNPTTWRTDIAIPELEKMNITYYNPQQVEEWRPELLEVEYQAKENATLMFFVLDNQTRGVSALIEVAHLAGNQRKLILVIQSYTQKNQIICDEHISQKEYEDLKTGQEVLQKLVERQRIPVYSDIKVALKSTENILREDLRTQDMHPSTATREFHLEPRDVFDKLDSDNSGKILLRETCLALRLLQRKNVSLEQLETMVRNLGYNLNGGNLDDAKIDYESFLRLMNEFETHQESGPFLDSAFLTCSSNFPCDVYLGGTLENTEWRETIAIPMLTLENLSYFTPKANGGRKQFTDVDAFAIESSYALLFVITGTARSIAAMAIAGHYIGRGANVVLCVQHLPEGAQLGSEVLSDRAIKDYNRGRMYLTDIAKRSGVSVFDEIPEAVESVVKKCAANRSRKYCFVTDGVRE
ncbi:hypothetical protein RUM43_010267 [Polyplax serrata]|uniref:EF-hand domain-containing protein n=1 Tax=Polyplax serrata TaxID=468196 RepID=A0AAN8P9A1_POLSC